MIMPAGQRLLLPVNPRFIALSLLLALLLNMLLGLTGQSWLPDVLALVLVFWTVHIHRRVLWFPLREQTLQVLPLFVVAAVIEWLTRLITQDAWPHWPQLIAPFLQTALWPVFGHVLLAPQRRPVDRDDIRPL
jgi:rod shape-determining protein MreD